MKSIFEPLLHANAKAFAALCAVLFVGMLGWGVYTEHAAARDAARAAEEAARRGDESMPVFEETKPIGLLAYVDSQTATGTEDAHFPVDLFRPPIDENGNPVRPGVTVAAQPQVNENGGPNLFQFGPGARRPGGGFGPGGWGNNGGNGGNGGAAAQPRDRELRYGGVFKKSDGTLAAWVNDSETGKGGFVKEGEEIGGATIVGGDTDTLRVRLADGSEVEMSRGGDPVVVGQVAPRPQSTGAAGQNQQRVRRMPTEAEIQEIEKRDPDLARRIREAIRRRNERQQNGN